jgi:c(7)-type cytochrome triheme protein
MNATLLKRLRLLPALSLAATLCAGGGAAADDSVAPRLPADVTYRGAEGSLGPVVFSHESHVALTERHCPACHPALFSILAPTGKLTHKEMNAGRRCGACHDDGTKASGVQDACDHCHRMGGGS